VNSKGMPALQFLFWLNWIKHRMRLKEDCEKSNIFIDKPSRLFGITRDYKMTYKQRVK
jgi:hypothetical protein